MSRKGKDGYSMHIISRKQLRQFVAQHPNAQPGLMHWYNTVKANNFQNLVELRAVFPATDQVGNLFVFNISGNTARLIAAIHFNRQKHRQKLYIRSVLF